MFRPSMVNVAAGLGALAFSLSAGVGIASADPDLDLAINTTCSYPQVVAALNAQDPQFGKAFAQSPILQRGLREFLAAGPDKRAQTAQDVANAPAFQPYLGVMEQAYKTCHNF
ncbi:hemophore-related protein [Mycobacteroides sp. LB1]|uniref:hemophore-related protein n=1 Tax=Mycobacteroides sp. LB1 TaxID=2750814 RepID=UPI0015DDCFE1|nr:hemophore-related protein [Mycobacteroides sp. LB1]